MYSMVGRVPIYGYEKDTVSSLFGYITAYFNARLFAKVNC